MGKIQDIFLAKIAGLVQRGRHEFRGVSPVRESRLLNVIGQRAEFLTELPADYDYRTTLVLVGTSVTDILNANPLRVFAGFAASQAVIFFGPKSATITGLAAPFIVNVNSPAFEVYWDRHRALVTLGYHAVSTAAAGSVFITEVVKVPGR